MSRELETLIGELVAASPGGVPPHPEPAELLAYRARRLGESAAEAVREHLVACRACAAALVDLDAFDGELRADPQAAEEPLDYSSAAAWRALAPRLAAEKSPEPASGEAGWWPAWGSRIAALLALAVLGLAIWGAQLRLAQGALERELAAPQANLPVVYLDELTRSGGEPAEFAVGGARIAVFLTPPAAAIAERYEIRVEAEDGRAVAEVDGLEVGDHGALRFALAARALPAGDYRVLLFPDAPDPLGGTPQQTPLAVYPLRVGAADRR